MKILDFIFDFIWPNRCPFCDNFIKWNIPYCSECYDNLNFTYDNNCEKCGQMTCMCRYKKSKKVYPRYDTCTSAVYYYETERKFILNMKSGAKENAKTVADILFNKIDVDAIDENCIFTCVPMTKKALRKRGYNQAELICKRLAENCNKPYYSNALIKVRETKSQKTLTASERAENLLKAFSADKAVDLKGKTVYLCDDIMTTGATLNECSKILKRAGASKVHCFVFAVTGFYEN